VSAARDPGPIEERAAEWLMRLNEGTVGLEHELELELWLDEDPENREALKRLARAWRSVGNAANLPELIDARADALEAMRAAGRRRWRNRFLLRWGAPAALAACLLLAILTLLRPVGDGSLTYHTGIGERRVITLADGSRMSLDAGTIVDVRYDHERRSLQLLAGRARFDVMKDPRRPFTVAAADRMVVATGTAFSVELVHSEMRVALYEGSVAVLEEGPSDQAPRHVMLGANPRLAADRFLTARTELIVSGDASQPARIQAIDPGRSLSWEQGQLVFSDEPLGVAVERVNRYARTKLVITDPRVAALPVSGAFNAGDSEGFVEGVATLYRLRQSRQGDSIVLSSARP
jgi:transmembrane sensor